MKTSNSFYKEALDGITKLIRGKHYTDVKDENVFYNPIFTTSVENEVHEETIRPFQGNRALTATKTYGDLLSAENTIQCPRLKAAIHRKIQSIHNIRPPEEENLIYTAKGGKEYTFRRTDKEATQYIIYRELIQAQSGEHVSQTKWVDKDKGRLTEAINWDKVWESVHQSFYTEETKSTIWEKIHLNFYTTYKYNKWHKTMLPCPLCRKIPEDVYHILFDCKFTKVMWKRLDKTLLRIIPRQVTNTEKAFGIHPRGKKETFATVLRNWLTFSLRHLILLEERKAYHIPNYHLQSMEKFFLKFNIKMQQELKIKKLQYDHRKVPDKFEKIVTINRAIASKENGSYVWKDIM